MSPTDRLPQSMLVKASMLMLVIWVLDTEAVSVLLGLKYLMVKLWVSSSVPLAVTVML